MNTYKAFIFDLNGTIIDDMPLHIKIWNQLFNEHGANHSLAQSKVQLYGKNSEILERIFPGKFTNDEKDVLEAEKEKRYRELYKDEMKAIKGLPFFLQKAFEKNIAMGLGTAAIKLNADFILDGLSIRHYFNAVVTSEDVTISKPHPETFLQCASILKVPPVNCIVFEDSPKGVETAANAGMQCVVLTTMHTAEEFAAYTNITFIVDDYSDERLALLMK
jgi:beta-phosphoglucomutase